MRKSIKADIWDNNGSSFMRHNNRNTKKQNTRRQKQHNGEDISVKDKFEEERWFPPIQPKTEKQAKYIELLQTKNIIIAGGLFGTGKTYIPSCMAADDLRQGRVNKIIVARPYVETGKSSGSKPGTTLEKLYPMVRTMLDTMKSRMSYGAFTNSLKDGLTGSIEVQEVASIRGRSFDEKCWIILDEGQQSSPEEMLSIITRISDNVKLVICGDLKQRDIKGKSGLTWLLDFIERHNIKGVGVIDFDSPDDIVRGDTVARIARGLAKDRVNGIYTPESR